MLLLLTLLFWTNFYLTKILIKQPIRLIRIPAIPLNEKLNSDRAAQNEYEVKLRNVKREQMKIVRSGPDFIVHSVDEKSSIFSKGVHVGDEIIGVNGYKIKGHQVKGAFEAIYAKKVLLRLRHHAEKFPKLRGAPHSSNGEYDVEFKEFPFGLELDNPPFGSKGAFIWKVDKGSYEFNAGVLKGDTLIGISGQNVSRTSWNIIKHVISNCTYPATLRFIRPKFPRYVRDSKKLPKIASGNVFEAELGKGAIGVELEEDRDTITAPSSKLVRLKKDGQAVHAGFQNGDHVIGMLPMFGPRNLVGGDMTTAKHQDIMKVLVSIPRPFKLRIFRGDLDDYRLAVEEAKALKEAAALGISVNEIDQIAMQFEREIDIPKNIAKLQSLLAAALDKPVKEIKTTTNLLELANGNKEKEMQLLEAVESEFHNQSIHDLSEHANLTIEELAIVAAKAPPVQKVRAVIAMKQGLDVDKIDPSTTVRNIVGGQGHMKLEEELLHEVAKVFGTTVGEGGRIALSASTIPLNQLAVMSGNASRISKLKAILALSLDVPYEDLVETSSIKTLSKGDSRLAKSLLAEVETAFGVEDVPDSAVQIPLSELVILCNPTSNQLSKLRSLLAIKLNILASSIKTSSTVRELVGGDHIAEHDIIEEIHNAFGSDQVTDSAANISIRDLAIISDGNMSALDKIRSLLSVKLKRPMVEIKKEMTISELVGKEKTREEQMREVLETSFGAKVIPDNAIHIPITNLSMFVGAAPLKMKLLSIVARKLMRPAASINEQATLDELTSGMSKENLNDLTKELKHAVFKEIMDNQEITQDEVNKMKIDFSQKLEDLSENLTSRIKNNTLYKLTNGLNTCLGGDKGMVQADKSLRQIARSSGISIGELKREVQKDMAGGIHFDDLKEEDLDKPLSALAHDLTNKRRRKMRHATMSALRPKKAAKWMQKNAKKNRSKKGKHKKSGRIGNKRLKPLIPMPSTPEVMIKLRKIMSTLLDKQHFLPESNVKELISKVHGLNHVEFQLALSKEFAGISITSDSVPSDFDIKVDELAENIKKQGEELCESIPGKLRLVLKNSLKHVPDSKQLIAEALSQDGSLSREALIESISQRISKYIKISGKDLSMTEADFGMHLVGQVRKKFHASSKRHHGDIHADPSSKGKKKRAQRRKAKLKSAVRLKKRRKRKKQKKVEKILPGEDEFAYTLEKGPIGMKLCMLDGDTCGVQTVKDGGQASILGFDVGDQIKYVGPHKIPNNATALSAVLAYFRDQPRPLEVIIYRDPEYEQKSRAKHPIFDPNLPISNIDWASHTPHNELPSKVPPTQYEARWERAAKFKAGNITFCASPHGLGSEVKNFGRKSNLMKGIHALDHVIGIQGVDIQYEDHVEALNLISAAVENAGKKRPIIMRLEHHKKKFPPISDKPDISKSEYDVIFKDHPLDMGLIINDHVMDDGRASGRVADCLPGSFAAKKNIEEGDEIIGVEKCDVEHIDFASLYHMIHYAETPLQMRLRRFEKLPLPARETYEVDTKVKKKIIGKKIFFQVNERYDKCEIKNAVDDRIKGYFVVGINRVDVSHYTGRHVKRLLEGRSFLPGYDVSKKSSKSISLRLANPENVDVPDLLEDGSNIKDANLTGSEGVSFRLMARLKKKYKKKTEETSDPNADEYDVKFGHNLNGFEICASPDNMSLDLTVRRNISEVGSVIYDASKIGEEEKTARDTIWSEDPNGGMGSGDKIILINDMDVSEAPHKDIDKLIFEKVKGDRITTLRLKRQRAYLTDKSAGPLDSKNEVEILDLKKEDFAHLKWREETDFSCVLENSPNPESKIGKAGVQTGWRLVAIGNGRDVTCLPFPGVRRKLNSIPTSLRFRRPSKVSLRERELRGDNDSTASKMDALKSALKMNGGNPRSQLRKGQIEVILQEGSLGMVLADRDASQCVVKSVEKGGQMHKLGVCEGDRVVRLGEEDVPANATAYDFVTEKLSASPRPLRCVIYRKPSVAADKSDGVDLDDLDYKDAFEEDEDDDLHSEDYSDDGEDENDYNSDEEIEVIIREEPLGLTLHEVDGVFCEVNSVDEGGHAHQLGILPGDRIVEVHDEEIPESEDAFNIVMDYLKRDPKPIRILIFRDMLYEEDHHGLTPDQVAEMGLQSVDEMMNPSAPSAQQDQVKSPEDENGNVTIRIGPGSLDMQLHEVDNEACAVESVNPEGKGAKYGFKVGDEFVSIGGHEIPTDDTAFSVVMTYLKTIPRPLDIVVFRDHDSHKHNPKHSQEFDLEFEIGAGSLGMNLELIDEASCVVKSLEPDGQAAKLGFKVGDKFVSVGGIDIPEDTNALNAVMTHLKSLPRPTKVFVHRSLAWDPDAHKHRNGNDENASSNIEIIIEPGPLGIELEEYDQRVCRVKKVNAEGQGNKIGFKVGDEILSLGDHPIPKDTTAFETTMSYLKKLPRPLKATVFRPHGAQNHIVSDEDDEDHEDIDFVLEPGPLGMELEELDGEACGVKLVHPGGQGERIGFKVGDEFVEVGGTHIPEDSSAFQTVLHLLKTAPRPLPVTIRRERSWNESKHDHGRSTDATNAEVKEEENQKTSKDSVKKDEDPNEGPKKKSEDKAVEDDDDDNTPEEKSEDAAAKDSDSGESSKSKSDDLEMKDDAAQDTPENQSEDVARNDFSDDKSPEKKSEDAGAKENDSDRSTESKSDAPEMKDEAADDIHENKSEDAPAEDTDKDESEDIEKNQVPKSLPNNHIRATFQEGSIGIALMGVENRYCSVKRVNDSGQGKDQGIEVGDRIVKIGQHRITPNPHAYDDCMHYLKTLSRPVDVVVYRRPEIETHDIQFKIRESNVGMSLELEDEMFCRVKEVTKDGHAETLGIRVGDRVYSITGNKVPHDASALKLVMKVLKQLPRPFKIVVKREGRMVYEKKGISKARDKDSKRDMTGRSLSPDSFAKAHASASQLHSLPEKPEADEYVVTWKTARAYRRGGLQLVEGSDGIGAEVSEVGSKNKKFGIFTLDRLVGIQRTDVCDLPLSTVNDLLKGALAKSESKGKKKSALLILRFRHHGDKFADLPIKPLAREHDVVFHQHPLRKGGIKVVQHEQQICVAIVKARSFAEGHGVIPGQSIVGIDGKDMTNHPPNIVMHILQFSETPVSIRFRAVNEVELSPMCREGEIDVEVPVKLITRKHLQFKFDLESDGVEIATFDSKCVSEGLPELHAGDPLVGIEGMYIKDEMDTYIFYMLMKACKNKKKKTIKLRILQKNL